MSDEAQVEQKIADTLKDIEPGSSEEMRLSEQLAKELGFEIPSDAPIDPAVKELLDAGKETPAEEAPVEALVEHPTEQNWEYTHPETGKVHKFDNEADKLRMQIGADANKWKKRFDKLEAKVNEPGEQPTQPDQPVDPKALLFDEDIRGNEEWKPILNVLTTMMEKYHALSTHAQDTRFKGLTDQFDGLKGQVGETAARSEFGISHSDEAKILEKQPLKVQEGLAGLDWDVRLAVIQQFEGSKEAVAKTPSPLPRAVSPQQAHVESSARGEPDRDPEAAFEEKFYAASERDQQTMLGQLFKQTGGEL